MSETRSLYERLGGHEGILKLIKPFYADVRQHELLGPIFNSHIQDWSAHLEKIALLKIDCEGYEFEILRGAQKLLQRHRPLLFVEVHPEQLVQFGHSTQQLLDFLAPDYELEFWYFQIGRHAAKWSRTLEKFRRPYPHRCATVEEMLAASTSIPGPAQIYFLGRPKRPA